jgi:hypothetical protein
MDKRDSGGDPALIIITILAGSVMLGIWWFSTAVGLDFRTGISLVIELIFVAVLSGLSLRFGHEIEIISFGTVWPILLATFWIVWWPPLDYWAAKEFSSFMRMEDKELWWNAWYTKWGVLAAILGGGYGLKKWRSARDYY